MNNVNAPKPPEAPKERVPDPMCICGEPETPNVVHSTTGPCFRAPAPEPPDYRYGPFGDGVRSPEPKWDNTTVCYGSDCPHCAREKAEGKPAPAPEPMPCGICKGMGFYNTVYRDRIRCPNLCGDPNPILPTKAPEPKQRPCLRKMHQEVYWTVCHLSPRSCLPEYMGKPYMAHPDECAPEPKQWSEEPIPEEALHIAAQAWCDSETSDRIMDPPLAIAFAKRLAPYLALRAELAQAREEIAAIKRQAEDATEYVLAVDNRELRKEIEGLRIRVGEYEDMTEINKRFSEIESELASAREEIARLSEIIEQRDVDWATERAARERAEARVKRLAGIMETRIFALGSDGPICQLHRLKLSALVDFIRAALKPEPR